MIAVTGAPVQVLINGESRPQWSRLRLEAGDELSFGIIEGGTRFYIAFSGGVDVPVVMGSRSTYALGTLGGFQGRKLEVGDVIPIGAPQTVPQGSTIAEEHRPNFSTSQQVRIVLGLYDHSLTEQGLRNLTEEEWTLTPVADRMGLRYDGPGVEWMQKKQPFGAGSDPSNIVDATMQWAPFRSREGLSRSSCTETPSPEAGSGWWPLSSAPIWTRSHGPLPARRPDSNPWTWTRRSPPGVSAELPSRRLLLP